MFCFSVPGAKRPRNFVFLGRFAPFFFNVRVFQIRARVPNLKHFTNLKKMKRSCKYQFATATKVHTSHKYDKTSYH